MKMWAIFIGSCLMATAVRTDLESASVDNRTLAYGLVMGLGIRLDESGPVKGCLEWIMMMIWPVAVLFVFYFFCGLGAGDVKLMSVLCTILGWTICRDTICLSLAIGSGIGIQNLVRRRNIVKMSFTPVIALALFIAMLEDAWRYR